MSTPSKVIEHTVFFKVKGDAPQEKVDSWLAALRGLSSLDCVLHLSAGPALHVGAGDYTHALHSRYKSKEALAQYTVHPLHVGVVEEYGKPILEDLLALDWEADFREPLLETYQAFRIALLKPKDDLGEAELGEVVQILNGYKNLFPSIGQASFGENISPGRAKGFTLGFLCLFPGLKELEQLNTNDEHIKLQYEKVQPKMEKFVILDCCTSDTLANP
eukprot:Gb_29315 [translate_table: standard]